MKERRITIRIFADTRGLRAGLIRAEMRFTRSWLRRLRLRFLLWRVSREKPPTGKPQA